MLRHRIKLTAAMALFLVCALAAPAYPVNAVDTMVCKRVVLRVNDRSVLVNRLTGEVKYLLRDNGHWELLSGSLKREYQAMYDAQVKNEKAASGK